MQHREQSEADSPEAAARSRGGEPDLHLVSLAAVTWDFPLVGRTRMLEEAFRAAGQPSTFVQLPSLRSAAERIQASLAGRAEPGVVRPWPTWPRVCWRALGEARLRRHIAPPARALARLLRRRIDFDRAVALVVTPVWAPWLDALPFRAVVYDCIDDVSVMTPSPDLAPLLRDWEAELIDRADAAVVSAEALGDAIRRRRPELPQTVIRNGVATEAFARAAAESARPADLPVAGGRPIVGFVGALYEWIDWPLIAAVSAGLPEVDFVFVGPDDGNPAIAELGSTPNVHFLGARPYADVPAYVAAFDVAWVPFRSGDISAHANPVKIYEYLAVEKPVVVATIADPEHFAGLVVEAKTPADMRSRLLEKLEEGAEARGRRSAASRAFSERNSWAIRAEQYAAFTRTLLDGL